MSLKKYCFIHKGKPYGQHNRLMLLGKNLKVQAWMLYKDFTAVFGLGALSACAINSSSKANRYIYFGLTCFILALLYLAYARSREKKFLCEYCTTNREEAEVFATKMCKVYSLPANSHQIISEDGWYMVFLTKNIKKVR